MPSIQALDHTRARHHKPRLRRPSTGPISLLVASISTSWPDIYMFLRWQLLTRSLHVLLTSLGGGTRVNLPACILVDMTMFSFTTPYCEAGEQAGMKLEPCSRNSNPNQKFLYTLRVNFESRINSAGAPGADRVDEYAADGRSANRKMLRRQTIPQMAPARVRAAPGRPARNLVEAAQIAAKAQKRGQGVDR